MPTPWRTLAPPLRPEITAVRDRFQALDHFSRVFAIRPGERVLLLTDPLLDPRVPQAIDGLARARGATVSQYMAPTSQMLDIPEAVRPLLLQADFVVSTWFCSIISPFCIARRAAGQRWVKITYFRDLDLLDTPTARLAPEIVGALIRATAARMPSEGAFELAFSDRRGTDLRIGYLPEMRAALLAGNRWRGRMLADEPGCYVHYLPTHGPNLWDRTAHGNDNDAPVAMSGWVYAQGAVGFERPFGGRLGCRFDGDTIVEVDGDAPETALVREMVLGARLIELGCGFNPKFPRGTHYPAGSNATGALHFGVDLARPSDYLRRVLPQWEEPPVHVDFLITDATVFAGKTPLIQDGRLMALSDPEPVATASRYGDPVDLLEGAIL